MQNDYSDVVAERGLLSILISKPENMIEISEVISSADFAHNTNRIIFQTMVNLINENTALLDGIDVTAIRMRAIEDGNKNFDSSAEYLEALAAHRVQVTNLPSLARKVKDLSVKRKLIDTVSRMKEIVGDTDATSIEMISKIEAEVQETVNKIDQADSAVKVGAGFLDWANERADDPRDQMGIASCLPRYDRAIGGGFRPGSVNLVAARPKTFKSGTAINIARHVAIENKIPVLVLDTELLPEYQRARLGASQCKVPIDLLETGKWRNNATFIRQIEANAPLIEEANITHIYIGGWQMERTLSAMRYWLTKTVGRKPNGEYNDCLIIYDYIKLMKSKEMSNMAEWQVLGFYMTMLHDFVSKHKVPMLLFAQLNREGGIAAADRLIWFCSSFSTLQKKEREEVELDGPAAGNLKITCHLTRYGPGMSDDDYINLRVNFPCMYMEEGKMKSEMNPDGPNVEELDGGAD